LYYYYIVNVELLYRVRKRQENKTKHKLNFFQHTGQSKLFLKTETQQKPDFVWIRHNAKLLK